MWSTALTGPEIAWMRGRKLDGQEPGLLRYYRFNHHGSVLRNSAGLLYYGDDTFGSPQTVESTAPILALGPGGALSFSSMARYRVEVPHAADLNAYPLAVTCWLHTTENDPVTRGIVTKYVDSSGNGYSMNLENGHVRAW